MNYTAKQGRQIIKSRSSLVHDVFKKWENFIPQIFRLNWRDVQNKRRTKKNLGFMWLLSHQALVVNGLQANINHISTNCLSY
jgi:hypothetical protein